MNWAGGRILVAEDEILIALDLSSMLTDAGAEVVGPATTLRAAKAIAQSDLLTAAILDVRLGRETTDSIAAILSERQIPFVFYTGEELPADMQARWPNSTVIVKPARQTALIAAIARLFDPK
jgi:CheY-like chemotaxis protein